MEGPNITLGVAFLAGLVSFITPCVLPLVPVYLTILSGSSFDQLTGRGKEISDQERREIHLRVITNALAFILGFTIIFVVSGLVAGSIGATLKSAQFHHGSTITNWLLIVFGAVMVLMGINMAGFWKPAFLNTEARFRMQKGKWGLLSSGLIGAAFAFGWTPCIGPILAPILAIAAESGNKVEGSILLLSYSLGLAIPFFLSALSVNGLLAFSNKMKRHFHTLELVVGVILLLFGLLMFVLGVWAVSTKRDGLNEIRQRLDWLNKYTEKIEEGLIEETENGNDDENPTGEVGDFDVTNGSDMDFSGMPQNSQPPDPGVESNEETTPENLDPSLDLDGDGLPDTGNGGSDPPVASGPSGG